MFLTQNSMNLKFPVLETLRFVLDNVIVPHSRLVQIFSLFLAIPIGIATVLSFWSVQNRYILDIILADNDECFIHRRADTCL